MNELKDLLARTGGARGDADERVHRVRWLTSAGNLVSASVVETETSVAVTWARPEVDANYGVIALPNWDTTTYWQNKTAAGVEIAFGTAAPADAAVDVATFRADR